jgi:hypothetical protein
MHKLALTAIAALAVAVGSSSARAQTVAEGLQSSVQALPGNVGAALVLAQGLVTFDGQDLVLTPPAQPPQLLLHLPAPVFTAFLADVGSSRVLLAESSTNALWLVPLVGPPPGAPLATIPLPYDALRLGPNRVIVSAKAGGFASPDNELVLLDLVTGQTQTLARLPGASGPIAQSVTGDLFYATASSSFPTPPGSCSVLRLPGAVVTAAIASATVLTLQHTQLVQGGLDTASDLAFDNDGDLHFVDWFNSRIGVVDDVVGTSTTLGAPLVAYAPTAPGAVTVQFVPAFGPGVFEPFQPTTGGTLYVFESDFVATSRLRAVTGAPALLSSSVPSPIPAGPAAFVVSSGPANGIAVLAFDTVVATGGGSIAVPGFEAPLLWSAALFAPPVTIVLPLDATGAGSLAYVNPGFASPLLATAQVAFVSVTNALGATNPLQPTFTQ